MKTFNELRAINVNEHTEKKDGLTYLSWAWAWDTFKQACPDATYEILKSPAGLPYFESSAGAMVYTKVTANCETHEMWLPVMDGKNKAMKSEPYTYSVRDWKTKQQVEKTVDAYSMFDINKTLMRCLVKNLAMFGLGLYIYAGEDVPKDTQDNDPVETETMTDAIMASPNLEKLREIYIASVKQAKGNQDVLTMLEAAKDARKMQLTEAA